MRNSEAGPARGGGGGGAEEEGGVGLLPRPTSKLPNSSPFPSGGGRGLFLALSIPPLFPGPYPLLRSTLSEDQHVSAALQKAEGVRNTDEKERGKIVIVSSHFHAFIFGAIKKAFRGCSGFSYHHQPRDGHLAKNACWKAGYIPPGAVGGLPWCISS